MSWSKRPSEPKPHFAHLTQRKGGDNCLNLSSPTVPRSHWVLRGTQWCRIIFSSHHRGCRQDVGSSETHLHRWLVTDLSFKVVPLVSLKPPLGFLELPEHLKCYLFLKLYLCAVCLPELTCTYMQIPMEVSRIRSPGAAVALWAAWCGGWEPTWVFQRTIWAFTHWAISLEPGNLNILHFILFLTWVWERCLPSIAGVEV